MKYRQILCSSQANLRIQHKKWLAVKFIKTQYVTFRQTTIDTRLITQLLPSIIAWIEFVRLRKFSGYNPQCYTVTAVSAGVRKIAVRRESVERISTYVSKRCFKEDFYNSSKNLGKPSKLKI